jgi:hypothetical protein
MYNVKYPLKGKNSPTILLSLDSNTLSKYHPEYGSADEGISAQIKRRADCHKSCRRKVIGVVALAFNPYG